MKHQIKTQVSAKFADTLEMTCSCGWFESVGKYTFNTDSMRIVRQEATYIKADHIAEKVAA